MRGALIAFEGLDRTGKTTQIAELERFLRARGRRPLVQKFPDRSTALGAHIDGFLQKRSSPGPELIHLLFSLNRWELKPQLLQWLAAGHDVILDRYLHSGVAYSHAQGLPLEWCWGPERRLPRPDLVVYLRPACVELLAARADYGAEVYERVDFQRRVGEVYDQSLRDASWLTVDASQTVEAVAREVGAGVVRFLEGDFSPQSAVREV